MLGVDYWAVMTGDKKDMERACFNNILKKGHGVSLCK